MNTVGLPWYSSATYDRAIRIMEDRAAFPSSYEAWQRQAETSLRRIERGGAVVYRVIIEPEEFDGWCRRQGIAPNATARERFAALAARRLFRERSPMGGTKAGGKIEEGNGAHGVD
ncbi:MAG: hypothetical protein RH982_05250 [Parvibaculum sp.]